MRQWYHGLPCRGGVKGFAARLPGDEWYLVVGCWERSATSVWCDSKRLAKLVVCFGCGRNQIVPDGDASCIKPSGAGSERDKVRRFSCGAHGWAI